MTKDRFIGARTTDELIEKATSVSGKDISKTIIQALVEFIMNNSTPLEKLEREEEELKVRMNEVKNLIHKEKERIARDIKTKKDAEKFNINRTPLDEVRLSIRSHLDTTNINTLLSSVYFKAYQKKLNYTPEQVKELILSLATEEEKKQMLNNVKQSPLD